MFLRNFGSVNGTILNHRALVQGEVPLSNGDVFEVGPLHFRVMIAGAEDEESCFSDNEFFTGQPGQEEHAEDSTIQVSMPKLSRVGRPTPPPDEDVRLC